jgi:Domain of unknown function (DUF1707)
MVAGRGDGPAGAGRGRLRASHADRERVIDTLKGAFVQGRLAKDEFDLRVGQALASRTHAELASVTADLPAERTPPQPPLPVQGGRPVWRPGPVILVSTALFASVQAFVFLPAWPANSEGDPPRAIVGLFMISTLMYLCTVFIAVCHLIAAGRQKRSGGRPTPGAGGQASRRPPSAGPGGELPPTHRG